MAESSDLKGFGLNWPMQKSSFSSRGLWFRLIAPFFLSALLFLNGFLFAQVSLPWFLRALSLFSGVLIFLAPLPILLVFINNKRTWAWLSVLINCAIVGWAKGAVALSFYFVFVIALAVPLAEGLKRSKSIEKSSIFAFLSMFLCAIIAVFAFSSIYHFDPIQEFQTLVNELLSQVGKSAESTSVVIDPADLDEFKHVLLTQFPASLGILSLFLISVNLALVFRINPKKIRESLGLGADFFKFWKVPESLVWPVIVTGALQLFELGWISDVAINIFKFLMAIFVIQGLSILSYFFDLWNIRGLFRWLGYILSICLMTPLVLFLGFFDLWFDFRGKFRQS